MSYADESVRRDPNSGAIRPPRSHPVADAQELGFGDRWAVAVGENGCYAAHASGFQKALFIRSGAISIAWVWRISIVFPTTSASMRVRRKQASACAGVSTIGSFSLKLVLRSTGTPVIFSNSRISR